MIPWEAPAIGATGGAIGWGRDAAFFSGQVYVQEALRKRGRNRGHGGFWAT